MARDDYVHPNKLAISIGAQVRAAREEAGMSQNQLATLVQVRRPTITNIENGKSEPSVDTLITIALVLEKPIEYFLQRVPREWRSVESSLSPEEKTLLIKFRDIQVARDLALAIYLIDAIAKFELVEFRRIVDEVKDRDDDPETMEFIEETFARVKSDWDETQKDIYDPEPPVPPISGAPGVPKDPEMEGLLTRMFHRELVELTDEKIEQLVESHGLDRNFLVASRNAGAMWNQRYKAIGFPEISL